ncbi:MAG: 5-formyltetrahydrofolate cyclo-ligase [Candidatus Aldehydirespiratoraceae bacterium]|jgi:5-formyltetrahydrofolate cyclo-ligase
MTDTAEERRAMRLVLRTRRAELDESDRAAGSMAVMARLARIPMLREATLIAGYRAVRGELDIDAALILLGERGATVTVPRVNGEHLEFVRWTEGQVTTPGPFGIPEPEVGDVVPLAKHAVVLAPLVAFDPEGNRLGQGGGFYDRALTGCGNRRPIVIGIAHAFQQVDAIPSESWDVPIDAVVTEDEVIEFRRGILDIAI